MFRNILDMLRAYREKQKQTKNADVISPETSPRISTENHLESAKSSSEEMRTGITSESSSQPTDNTSTTNPGEDISLRARCPSPCPFSPLPPPEQTEPFPTLEEDEKEWDEWNEWNDDIRTVPYALDHCTQHCRHPICRRVIRGNERINLDQEACQCSLEPPPATTSKYQVPIQEFSEEDIAAVQSTYDHTSKHDLITVNLGTAITLVDLLRQNFHLNLCSRLQWDPRFTPNTLLHGTQYNAAVQSTNGLVDKLFVHLMLLLGPTPNQTRCIELQELQQTLQSVMRLEFFWWQATWCFKQQQQQQQQERIAKADDSHVRKMMKDGFVRARRRYICGRQSVGIRVMMEKLEDIVEMVVGVLVWWSECTRRWAEEEKEEEDEDAESTGLDSSVASFVTAQSHVTGDDSDVNGRDGEKV